MKLKVSETVETEWWISDELKFGEVWFSGGLSSFSYSGEWMVTSPTNPELRAAVEKQWNKLRPLAENEWRDGNGCIAVFKDFNGEPRFQFVGDGDCLNPRIYTGPASRACLAWHEKHYGNTVNGYEFRMGEFGVEYLNSGRWLPITKCQSGSANNAREWMRRKGIKIGGES